MNLVHQHLSGLSVLLTQAVICVARVVGDTLETRKFVMHNRNKWNNL